MYVGRPSFEDQNLDSINISIHNHYNDQHQHQQSSHSHHNSMQLIDQLSNLFKMITVLCQEQFNIIISVFPVNTIPRVTRLLIQRIFNDPAFGIQIRVDNILKPKYHPPLAEDYLNALVTVREKLNALYLLLIECCSHSFMIGMGNESMSIRKARNWKKTGGISDEMDTTTNTTTNNNQTKVENREHLLNNISNNNNNDKDENENDGNADNESGDSDAESDVIMHRDGVTGYSEERIRSDGEIREFFEEQVCSCL